MAAPGTACYDNGVRRLARNRPASRMTSPLPACICSSLRMVTRAVTQQYDAMLRSTGLRITQYSVLANIARAGESTVDHLTEVMVIDQTTLTRSLTLLELAGLIQRVPHPDKRARAVRVTQKGVRALNRARPLWARAQAQVLRMVGGRVWGETRRGLARLLAASARSKPLRGP